MSQSKSKGKSKGKAKGKSEDNLLWSNLRHCLMPFCDGADSKFVGLYMFPVYYKINFLYQCTKHSASHAQS
jgi:hypothetical protein